MFAATLRHGPGPLNTLDVRAALAGTLLACCALAITQSFTAAWGGLLLGLLLVLGATLHPRDLLRRLLPANVFLGLLGLSLALTYPGEPWPALPLCSREGVWLAARIALKGNAILLTLAALAGVREVPELCGGLERLGLPRRLALLLGFAYSQTFLVARELERLLIAARIRGFVLRADRHSLRVLAYCLAQTLARSLDRAQRLRQAMLLRGFDGRFHSLRIGRARPRDLVFALVMGATALGLLLLDRFAAGNAA